MVKIQKDILPSGMKYLASMVFYQKLKIDINIYDMNWLKIYKALHISVAVKKYKYLKLL